MTWLKIDDAFADHPKIISLKDRAFRVHISALCYACRFPSEQGHIPSAALRQLGATPGIVRDLISSGVWEEMEDGIYIHDFTEYNPPPPAGLAEKRSEAGRRGGIQSAHTRASNRQASGKQLAWQANEAPSPSPSPIAIVSNEPIAAADAAEKLGVREVAETLLEAFVSDRSRRFDPGFIDECYDFARQFPGRTSDLAMAMRAVRDENKRPFPGNLRPHMPGWQQPIRSSSNGRPQRPLGLDTQPGEYTSVEDPRTGLPRDPKLIAANDALHRQLERRDARRAAAASE